MIRAFYEFPKPKKIYYTVAVQPDDPNTCECAVADCKTLEHEQEYDCTTAEIDVYECDVCGQWFCVHHMDEDADLCLNCVKLPPGIRAMIEAFREELNR